MKRTLLLILLLLAACSFAMAADAPAYPAPVNKKLYADDVRGKPAPAFVVEKWLTAKPNVKGKVVLIDFWATWCPPCRATIPELNEYQAKFKDNLVVIGVSDEPAATVTSFAASTPMKYASAIDSKGTMKKSINVAGIPHVLIISTDGIVRWQGFPLSQEEPLTADIIKKIIAADPGTLGAIGGKESEEVALKGFHDAKNWQAAIMQDANDTCGLFAADSVIFSLIGKNDRVGFQTLEQQIQKNAGKGAFAGDVEAYLANNLENVAATTTHTTGLNAVNLESYVSQGQQLIVHVDGNHFVRVIGTFTENGVTWVKVYDPARGTYEQVISSFITRAGAGGPNGEYITILPLNKLRK